jgi:hypothetical protein
MNTIKSLEEKNKSIQYLIKGLTQYIIENSQKINELRMQEIIKIHGICSCSSSLIYTAIRFQLRYVLCANCSRLKENK